MATSYRTPLEKWKAQRSSRPSDAAVQVSPPKPKVRERPKESYRDFLRRVWKEQGYPFKPANPGDFIDGTCPYHGRVRKVFNHALVSVCLECYPDEAAKYSDRKD